MKQQLYYYVKSFLLVVALNLNYFVLKAQDRVMIISFEPQMFRCEWCEGFYESTGWSYREMTLRFRSALDQNIFQTLQKNGYQPVSLYESDQTRFANEQGYIYKSIAYDYELIDENGNELEKPFNGIENGQVVSRPAFNQKLIKVKITNSNLLNTLYKTYLADYFLFIAETDVLPPVYNAYKKTEMPLMVVHITLYDKTGQLVYAGIIKEFFPGNWKEPQKLFKRIMPVVAEKIVKTLKFNKN